MEAEGIHAALSAARGTGVRRTLILVWILSGDCMQLGMLADVSDAWEKLSLQQKRTLNVIGFGIGALALSSLMAGRTDDNCDQKPTDTNMGIPVSKARIPQHTQALRFCGTSTPTHILTEFL